MEPAVSTNGDGEEHRAISPRYCAHCGRGTEPGAPAIERFGEPFCTEAHAEAFVQGVRAARVRATAEAALLRAGAADPPAATEGVTPAEPALHGGSVQSATRVEPAGRPVAPASGWKRYLKLGVCCGAPLLAIILLAGGGGALLGAFGALLPLLALLACPLAMYFMMRGMSKGHHDRDRGAGP